MTARLLQMIGEREREVCVADEKACLSKLANLV